MKLLKYLTVLISIFSLYYVPRLQAMEKDFADLKPEYLKILHQGGTLNTILLTAIHQNDLPTIKWVVEKGAKVSYPQKPERFGPPLAEAVYEGHIKIVQYLLDQGAPVNEVNRYGKTPLAIARDNKRKDIIDLLLTKGAKE